MINTSIHKKQTFQVLVKGGLFLVGTSLILTLFNYLHISFIKKEIFTGISPLILLVIWLGIWSLIWISKNHKSLLATYLFLILLWLPTAYSSFRWGALFYQAIIIYALVIVLTGILLNNINALIVTEISSVYLISLTYLQFHNLTPVDITWRKEKEDIYNAIIVSLTLVIIFVVSWLYNNKLEKDRKSLDARVKKQTDELKLAQAEKMMQWQQFVEVGRSALEIFHDIKNPLTSASLNLEQLHNTKNLSKQMLEKISLSFESLQYIGKFINSTQQQLSRHQSISKFSPAKQIDQAVQIMLPKATLNRIEILLQNTCNDLLVGPKNKFFQTVINLISNSIDSYYECKNRKKRKIIVNLYKKQNKLIMKIQDFGTGITENNNKKIFEPMYTTKDPNRGIGLGLTIAKNTIENEFNGTITYESRIGKGSIFTVTIPLSPTP